MTTRVPAVLLAGLLLIGGAVPVLAADTWVEVKSNSFTVVSNAGEKRAREVAWQFEQIRAAILAVWPWVRGNLDRPMLVVAAKDENAMKALVPEFWEERGRIHPDSVFVTAPDRHYIAVRADARSDDTDAINPYSTSYWAYSALLLGESFDRDLPLWLRNGLAGLLSNTIVRQNEIRLGMAPPWYLRSIATDARLRLSQLFTTESETPYYRDPATRSRFDAQAWALVHYLLFSSPESSAKTDAVVKAVMSGTPSIDAVQQAFGSLEVLENAYMQHVRKEIISYSRLKTETRITTSGFAGRTLNDADAATARAALHAAMGRPVEARALVADARRAADTAAAYEVEAMLADRDGNRDATRAALTTAEQLGTSNFYVLYRLASLDLPQNPDAAARAKAEQRLQKAVALNPFHANAHAMLANVIAGGPVEGRARAVPIAQKAVTLAPGDSFVRLSLARALWDAGQRDIAMGQARAALSLAKTDPQRRQAQEMIAFFEKNAPPR